MGTPAAVKTRSGPKWVETEIERKGFWRDVKTAFSAEGLGTTPLPKMTEMVLAALNVEIFTDYTGSREKAIATVKQMLAKLDEEEVEDEDEEEAPPAPAAVTPHPVASPAPAPAPASTPVPTPVTVKPPASTEGWNVSVTTHIMINNHDMMITVHNGVSAADVRDTVLAALDGLRGIVDAVTDYGTIIDGRDTVVVMKGKTVAPNTINAGQAGGGKKERIGALKRNVKTEGEGKNKIRTDWYELFPVLANGKIGEFAEMAFRKPEELEQLYALYPNVDFAATFPVGEMTDFDDAGMPDFWLYWKEGREVPNQFKPDGTPKHYRDLIKVELVAEE